MIIKLKFVFYLYFFKIVFKVNKYANIHFYQFKFIKQTKKEEGKKDNNNNKNKNIT